VHLYRSRVLQSVIIESHFAIYLRGYEMVVRQKYNIIDMDKGTLDRDIFVGEQIYQEELEKVFGRAWLWVGHESLIPNPNDFFLTYMGEDPVILTRDAKGEVHAFLNMCRHRGNRIVRADDGNAKNFMCSYHGWTYSNEGKLVSVPGLQEAYYGELDVDNLGLVPVAHLDTYAGFVFATWDKQAPSLESYLGDMRFYMDIMFNRREGGIHLFGPDKWLIRTNWKNPADNFIGDMYHGAISHGSAMIVREKMLSQGNAGPRPNPYAQPGNQVAAGNGHGCYVNVVEHSADLWNQQGQQRHPALVDYEKSILPEIEQRIGHLRARRTRTIHHTVFPNMSWLNNGTVRMWHPRGPDQVEIWAFVSVDMEAPDDLKHLYKLASMQMFGPSGMFEQDDMDNWRNAAEAGRSTIARKYRQNIAMGIGHEQPHQDLPGSVVPRMHAEVAQRGMYNRWQQFMNAESWADIPIDPITAKFEGTAGMKG